MLKVENIEVVGLEPAIRGMRNPKNSWDRSDSFWTHIEDPDTLETADYQFFVGDADLNLMQTLFKAGTEHRKFARMIQVYMDITAPLFWWKEFDTYKIGTVANSGSTMHKIHAKEFVPDDFSFDTTREDGVCLETINGVVDILNHCRDFYLKTGDKRYWRYMIELLPSSYNQKRTVMMNYEVCARIIQQRTGHKLTEWHTLVEKLSELPYMEALIR